MCYCSIRMIAPSPPRRERRKFGLARCRPFRCPLAASAKSCIVKVVVVRLTLFGTSLIRLRSKVLLVLLAILRSRCRRLVLRFSNNPKFMKVVLIKLRRCVLIPVNFVLAANGYGVPNGWPSIPDLGRKRRWSRLTDRRSRRRVRTPARRCVRCARSFVLT